MRPCAFCGTVFDPGRYQVIAGGRSFHSVECAVRALEQIVARDAAASRAGAVQNWVTEGGNADLSPGRTYSLTGILRSRATDPGREPR